jgi:hypothetical protein
MHGLRAQSRPSNHPWIGLKIQEITPDIANTLGRSATGALVNDVTPSGPADNAGIRRGDVIETFGPTAIVKFRDLPIAVATARIGQNEPMTIWRSGRELSLAVTVRAASPSLTQSLVPAAPPPDKNSVLCSIGRVDGRIESFWSSERDCQIKIEESKHEKRPPCDPHSNAPANDCTTGIPGTTECIARGFGWEMDITHGQCIRIRDSVLNQSEFPQGDDAIQKFCAYASSTSCSLFKSDVHNCESRAVVADGYFHALKSIEGQYQVSPRQALTMMGSTSDPWAARDAVEALDSMSQVEFKAAELSNCLQKVINQN